MTREEAIDILAESKRQNEVKEIHGMGDLKHSFASRYESIIFSSEKEFLFNG